MGCIIKIGNQSVSETDFLNHLNKIISVNKLFEENPKFSSQIYEALGFKQFKFEHLSKYSNLSDFTLNKKEEAVNFLQSLDGKKLFSPSEMLSRISNADTSRINKGLSDYLNSILEQYQGIYAEELINPYRIEFKEQLKLGDDRDDTIGDLRGYNRAGYKAINLTNVESNDLIKTILHEFVHDIEPYVLFKESKLIRFTKTKGSNTPLTEEQLKIGNQLENLRKLVIKHLAEEFKNKKPDSLKNEIERLENGGLITIYGELKKPTLVYINNLKNELNAVNRLIETNKVEEFIENNKQFFLNNEYNHYGVTNLNEFITEALTNDKFRKLLNEIPYKNTTILSYLFELFQKILGIKKDTVLSEALNLIHEVATTKRGQLRDFQITPQQKQQAQQLYSQYLDTIFPDSQVKDIVYHGSNIDFTKQSFKRDWIGNFKGIYFYFKNSSLFGKQGYKFDNPAIINVATPEISYDKLQELIANNEKFAKTLWNLETNAAQSKTGKVYHGSYLMVESVDGTKSNVKYYERVNDNWVEVNNGTAENLIAKHSINGDGIVINNNQAVVFEPEQIHILGSKQDIEGFKQFVNKNTTQVVDNNQLQKQNIFTVNPIQSADKKAIVKASVANKYIGFAEGIEGSSTASYAEQISKQTTNKSNININKTKWTKDSPKQNPNTAYVFTENINSIGSNRVGGGSAVIRNNPNAVGIVTKKYYVYSEDRATSNIKGGWNQDFEDTDNDFELFKKVNLEQFAKLDKYNSIIFPDSFANSLASIPNRFALWLQNELQTRYGLITELNSKGTGLISKSINVTPSNIVNSGNYSSNDVIFVSIGGKRGNEQIRKEQQDKTIREALKAIEAGATLITDNKSYVESSDYNEGEKRLAKNLEAKGYNYSEQTIDGKVLGIWNKNNSKEYKNEGIIPVIRNNDSRFKPISPSDIDENITPCDK